MASRETGVVRQRLGGDTAVAQRLNGIARTQLGILKELMAFGNLQQLSRTVRLGDGTEIFVQSVFGQDSVRITPPVAAVEVIGEEEEVSVAGSYVYVVGTDGIRTYRWKIGVDGRRLISTTDVGPAPQRSDLYMSDDGSVVVIGAGDGRVYRWAESTGAVEDIGVTYLDLDQRNWRPMIHMSRDGSVIGVMGYDPSLGSRVYRWTAESGAVDLGVNAVFFTLVMSQDGSTLATVAYVTAQPDPRVFMWSVADGLTQIPDLVTDPNHTFAMLAMSADGSALAIGAYPSSTSYTNLNICRYAKNGGVMAAGVYSESRTPLALTISDDGSSILFLGQISDQDNQKVYYWRSGYEPIDTGLTVNFQYAFYNNPFATSANGDVSLVLASGTDWYNVRPNRWSVLYGAENSGIVFNYAAYGPSTALSTSDGAVSSFSGQYSTSDFKAYRWPNPGVPTDLGDSTYVANSSMVTAISPDGLILAGTSGGRHTLWTPDERFAFAPSASQYFPKQITKIFYD